MTSDPAIPDIVCARFPLPAHFLPAGSNFWLTLYLVGTADAYAQASSLLQAEGWQNLDKLSGFSGFAYPKRVLPNAAFHVREALATVFEICNATGLTILEIDADTAFDPEKSAFQVLYQVEDRT